MKLLRYCYMFINQNINLNKKICQKSINDLKCNISYMFNVNKQFCSKYLYEKRIKICQAAIIHVVTSVRTTSTWRLNCRRAYHCTM